MGLLSVCVWRFNANCEYTVNGSDGMTASNTVADHLIQDTWMASHLNPLSQYLRLAAYTMYIMYYMEKHVYSMYVYISKVLVDTPSFLLLASVLCTYFRVHVHVYI